jgi:hypothetical protein
VRLVLDSSNSISLVACGNVGVGVSRDLVRKRLRVVRHYLAQMTRFGLLRRNPGSTISEGVTHVKPEQIILVEHDGECRACGDGRVDAIRVHLVDRKAYVSAGGLDCQ